MKKFLFLLISVLFIYQGPILTQEKDGILLRYKYPENKKLTYNNENWVEIGISRSHVKIMRKMTTEEQLTIATDEGGSNLSVLISDIDGSAMVGNRLTVGKIIRNLKGEEFRYSLSPTGEISGIVYPSMAKARTEKEMEYLEHIISEIELDLSRFHFQLPEKPVKVGDSWSSTFKSGDEYKSGETDTDFITTNNFTVKKETKKSGFKCFEIEVKSNVEAQLPLNLGEYSIIYKGSGNTESEIVFDYERGLLIKYESKGTLNVNIEGYPNPVLDKVIYELKLKRELKDID